MRRSKRGCMSHTSRMSPASLPRPEMSPMRASNTASTACCNAGDGASPPSRKALQRSSTSCHSMHASMKLGTTARPSATRLSVSDSAKRTNFSRVALGRSLASTASSTGNRPRSRPCFFSSSMLRSEWPVCISLTISSNSREGGTFARSADNARIGLRVAGSISKPSLAAKRTARMMRTGSSR